MIWRPYAAIGLKLAPYVAVAILLAVVLWFRGDLAKAEGAKKALAVELQGALDANKEAAKTVEGFRAQRVDNDAIAEAILKRFIANRALFERRTILLKEARNDPTVKPWADTPVPGRVRKALAADSEIREPPR